MDPYHAAAKELSAMGVHCLSKRLLKYFSRRQKQTIFYDFREVFRSS